MKLTDYLGQELKVGQTCFYMNSSKGQIGNKVVIKEIVGEKEIRILRDGHSSITTVKFPRRFIVLSHIMEAEPHLFI